MYDFFSISMLLALPVLALHRKPPVRSYILASKTFFWFWVYFVFFSEGSTASFLQNSVSSGFHDSELTNAADSAILPYRQLKSREIIHCGISP